MSYSRSRGLFLGVAIDGSVLEIDQDAHLAFYGSPSSELPRQLPQVAAELRQELVSLTPGLQSAAVVGAPVLTPAAGNLDALRRALDSNSRHLYAIIDPPWQQYLAMPREVFESSTHPNPQTLGVVLQRYDLISTSGKYQRLVDRPEFQSTHEVLREYLSALTGALQPALQLPPPPAK